MSAELTIPDSIEPILACRAFRFTSGKGNLVGPRLMGYGVSAYWRKGTMQATHEDRGGFGYSPRFAPENHVCPDSEDRCGFWGFSAPENLLKEVPDSNSHLFGVVELWGKVIPGEWGWRAQYVRLVSLMERTKRGFWGQTTDRDSLRLAREYEVPLIKHWPELTPPKEDLCEPDEKASPSPSSRSTSIHSTNPDPSGPLSQALQMYPLSSQSVTLNPLISHSHRSHPVISVELGSRCPFCGEIV